MPTLSDPGKLMRAKFAGDCAECRGSILPGQEIYHSRLNGDRHRQCVEPGPAPEPAASRARDDGRLWSDDDARRWAQARDDATPRDAARATAGGPAADRRDVVPDAQRPTPSASPPDAYVAPARATEFGRAGDRDAARRELGQVLELFIDAVDGFSAALKRIHKLLD